MSIDSNDYNSDFVLSSHNLKKYESETQLGFNSFITNPFKKPFLPKTWKWFRTSGEEKIYDYRVKEGETVKVDFKIPKYFTSSLLSFLNEISVDGIGKPIVPLNGSEILFTDIIGEVSVNPYPCVISTPVIFFHLIASKLNLHFLQYKKLSFDVDFHHILIHYIFSTPTLNYF